MSDYKGASLMIDALPRLALLAGRDYDADWFRAALTERGITPCIPSKVNRKVPIFREAVPYRQGHRIENMFGKLQDWRRIYPATTDAPTRSCPPSVSPQPSSSGSINEA